MIRLWDLMSEDRVAVALEHRITEYKWGDTVSFVDLYS